MHVIKDILQHVNYNVIIMVVLKLFNDMLLNH